ncbi:Zinc finger protein [Dirofilaria immitis]|nr:Zinc finger protein [Dirofilaria immitis]
MNFSHFKAVSSDARIKWQSCPLNRVLLLYPEIWNHIGISLQEHLLRVHMEECRLLRMHECQQCGKRFKARGGLQQHLRIHSNDRPYQCRFCPKRFTQKSHVDQHERIHTGAKPFSCQFCGRAFRQRSQQLGHESTHASGPLSMGAHLPHASSHHIKFENANADQGCSQAAAGDASSIERNAVVQQQAVTAVATAAAVAVAAQQQDRLNNSGSSTLNLMSPNGTGLAHSAVSSLLALSQQQQTQGMAMSQSTQQTIADAIGTRNNAV